MQVCVMDRKILTLDDEGQLDDSVEVKDVTSHTLNRLVRLCESELQDRDYKKDKP